MKLKLSPSVIDGIHELQDDTDEILIVMIEAAEIFILDNIDSESDEDNLIRKAVGHIKTLRTIRELLVKISRGDTNRKQA
jgi:hypothetical protein